MKKNWMDCVLLEEVNDTLNALTTSTLGIRLNTLKYIQKQVDMFVATFDSIKDTAVDAVRKICDFIGARIVFLDLRDSFLFNLGARLDIIVPYFATARNHICSLIDDNLRDLVVSSICKVSMAMSGYCWMEALVHFQFQISQ
ncbi:protein unc-13 homolog isoform X2 [Actinidia eriantha]|uniref:protein unc-13 homolog isoform X2 n=1 Tax=Actinidia eriantha TaxID=165200 RepID=UPI0025893ACE|nr:protein unc-13 homolog isoform X2 [Actinidia eriantha]